MWLLQLSGAYNWVVCLITTFDEIILYIQSKEIYYSVYFIMDIKIAK